VYGNPKSVPIDEDHPKDPVNSYGETKWMFERILRWYADAYGWSVVAFRYFNACGATENAGEDHRPETHIIPLLLETAAGNRPHFDIYGDDYDTPDGTCIRDYVHVSDIAAAHVLALNILDHPGVTAFNIGCGHGYSVKEVLRAAEEVTERRIPIRTTGRRAGDPAVLCASPEKLRRELKWDPKQSDLHGIIRSAWKWRLQNPAGYDRHTPAGVANAAGDPVASCQPVLRESA
jgi:UDP-glucose 4-epimerase